MIAFLIIVVPAGIKWYLIVVLIYFFLMISEIEHLFMCLWPFICLLWKIRSSDHFLVRSFVFSLLSCMSSFVYTRYQLLIKYMICKFFSHSVCSLFVLWRFLSLCRSFLIWCCPTCLFFLLFPFSLVLIYKYITQINVMELATYVFFQEFYGFRSYIQVINPFWVHLCLQYEVTA